LPQVTPTAGHTEIPVQVPVQSSSLVVAPQNRSAGGSAVAESAGAVGAGQVASLAVQPYTSGVTSRQVDGLLHGGMLTEATSDRPDGVGFASSTRGRRRPTFLYIKPVPLPDLIPDIELPLP